MRLTIGQLAEKIAVAGSKSRKRIYRKATGKWEPFVSEENPIKTIDASERPPIEDVSNKSEKETENNCRKNEMEIQMLSAPMYEQVFRNTVPRTSNAEAINR